MIEDGIMVKGVGEISEEGCRILSEMERSGEVGRVEEGGEEERYVWELYLVRIRGEEKKLTGSEVSRLKKEVEELRREVEGLRRDVEEERRMKEEEQRKRRRQMER